MSARGTWRVGQAQSYNMNCVGTNAQEVTRCSDYKQAFQERGVQEEGGVTWLLIVSCFCSSLQLRSEDPAPQRQGALQLCQFSERPGP